MSEGREPPSLALLVQSRPYEHRSARAELDVALAALAMDFRVEIFFLGASILQLLADRDAEPALLPSAYRAWAAMPGLGEVKVFVENKWLERLAGLDLKLILPVQGVESSQMQDSWRHCQYSMVL